jgi:dTDP-3-amino-3,4,6-trideoxy-alpha-D-glucose transaminase
MVPVHLYGFSLDLDRLQALRDQYHLSIVEDCAQSIGACWQGRPTGSVGQVAATSFYPTKNLGAFGDGGALLTNSAELAADARMLRDYGQSAKYRHEAIGYNSRLDELQAALLHRVALPRLPEWTEKRRRIAGMYRRMIVNALIQLPSEDVVSEPVWHLFPIRVPPSRKAEFMLRMREKEVSTAEHYPSTLADQPVMSSVSFAAPYGVEKARGFCAEQVSLPIHPYLSDDEVEQVAAACNAWE